MIKRFSYLIVNIGIESDVIRYFHCMMIKLAIDDKIITVLSCYAPQVGLKNIIKDTSYDQMQNTVRKVGVDETLVICGDLNAHIIKLANGYEGVDGGYNYGLRNKEGENILESAVAHNLLLETCISPRKTTI